MTVASHNMPRSLLPQPNTRNILSVYNIQGEHFHTLQQYNASSANARGGSHHDSTSMPYPVSWHVISAQCLNYTTFEVLPLPPVQLFTRPELASPYVPSRPFDRFQAVFQFMYVQFRSTSLSLSAVHTLLAHTVDIPHCKAVHSKTRLHSEEEPCLETSIYTDTS